MTCAQGLLRLLWGGPKLECYGTDWAVTELNSQSFVNCFSLVAKVLIFSSSACFEVSHLCRAQKKFCFLINKESKLAWGSHRLSILQCSDIRNFS